VPAVPAVTVQERYPLTVLPLDRVAEASALAKRRLRPHLSGARGLIAHMIAKKGLPPT
jgi:hypothetical protein